MTGTLLAAILTQFLSSRRERRQRERQSAQELVRWERERQERREQWEREDAARWQRERYNAYAELLLAIERWVDIALHEKPYLQFGRRAISHDGVSRLDSAHAVIDNALISIELLAPESIRGRARFAYMLTSYFTLKYKEVEEEAGEDAQVQQEIDDEIQAIHDCKTRLRDAIRRDLGIEFETQEDRTPDSLPAEPKRYLRP